MTLYTIKRDGETVGVTDDPILADHIDGLEIHNEATDPAYAKTHESNVNND
mgnify:CR=1 FL=1